MSRHNENCWTRVSRLDRTRAISLGRKAFDHPNVLMGGNLTWRPGGSSVRCRCGVLVGVRHGVGCFLKKPWPKRPRSSPGTHLRRHAAVAEAPAAGNNADSRLRQERHSADPENCRQRVLARRADRSVTRVGKQIPWNLADVRARQNGREAARSPGAHLL